MSWHCFWILWCPFALTTLEKPLWCLLCMSNSELLLRWEGREIDILQNAFYRTMLHVSQLLFKLVLIISPVIFFLGPLLAPSTSSCTHKHTHMDTHNQGLNWVGAVLGLTCVMAECTLLLNSTYQDSCPYYWTRGHINRIFHVIWKRFFFLTVTEKPEGCPSFWQIRTPGAI